MTETVELPDELYDRLAARRRADESVAGVIERNLRGPHPAETRAALSPAAAERIEAAIDRLDE
ncbi:MAG: hypothetical protein ABEI75_04570 [Halobaculum sp.]